MNEANIRKITHKIVVFKKSRWIEPEIRNSSRKTFFYPLHRRWDVPSIPRLAFQTVVQVSDPQSSTSLSGKKGRARDEPSKEREETKIHEIFRLLEVEKRLENDSVPLLEVSCSNHVFKKLQKTWKISSKSSRVWSQLQVQLEFVVFFIDDECLLPEIPWIPTGIK